MGRVVCTAAWATGSQPLGNLQSLQTASLFKVCNVLLMTDGLIEVTYTIYHWTKPYSIYCASTEQMRKHVLILLMRIWLKP